MHLPSLAQRITSERKQAAAATHNNTHRFSGRTGISIGPPKVELCEWAARAHRRAVNLGRRQLPLPLNVTPTSQKGPSTVNTALSHFA